MRKRSTLRTWFVTLPCLLVAIGSGAQAARGSETPLSASSELSNESVDRARSAVARIQNLVGAGTLPQSSLDEAQARLADINDEATLKETLYSSRSTTQQEDLTSDQRSQMLAAAQRRLDRQASLVCERQRLLDLGIISRSEMESASAELEIRRHVLDLAKDRVRLEMQRAMLNEEQSLERALESGTTHTAMLKFDGNGHFDKTDLAMISAEFEEQFHYPLPITARGQTSTHQSLGFDHRGKIDVGLNPEDPEGIWLRHFLVQHQIPFIGFRSAVRGSATAPHIHLGTGSTRVTELQPVTVAVVSRRLDRRHLLAMSRDRARLTALHR